MTFDISSLAKHDSATLQLRHPATDELLYADDAQTKPLEIELYGTSSKQYRKALMSMQNARLKRGKKVMSAEAISDESIDLLVTCSIKANNFEYKGKPVEGETFRELYNDPSFNWLKDQVDEAIGDVQTFLD